MAGRVLERIDGNITITSDLTDAEVFGCVSLNANDITVSNVRIHDPAGSCFGWGSSGITDVEAGRGDLTGIVIHHVEIDGSADTETADNGISFMGDVDFEAHAVKIHDVDDCMSFMTGGTADLSRRSGSSANGVPVHTS